jgi:hypothetical protein
VFFAQLQPAKHDHRAGSGTQRLRTDSHADRDGQPGHYVDPHLLSAGPNRDPGRAHASAHRGPDEHSRTDRDSRRHGHTGNDGDSGRHHDTRRHGDAARSDAHAPLYSGADVDADPHEYSPPDRDADAANFDSLTSPDADALTPGADDGVTRRTDS